MRRQIFAVGLVVALLCLGAFAQETRSRMGRELRTVNTDTYEISVLKNGRTSINLPSREHVFDNACPLVWLEGEDKPRPLSIDGRWTERLAVQDGLGQGQGLHFCKKEGEWFLRAYPPAQPFLTVQAAFTNTMKKPVKVKMLIPWSVGVAKAGSLSLGAGTKDCVVLDNGGLADTRVNLRHFPAEEMTSQWHLTLYNPATERSLVAGFLTNNHCFTQIRTARSAKADDNLIDTFSAECVYDPPVELVPGQRIESEVLFLAVSALSPFDALEGFGQAVAHFNNKSPYRGVLSHGWDSWNTKFKTEITEDNMMMALDFVDKNLKRYGWKHFALDDGWQIGKGNWEVNTDKFPHGLRWFTDQVHARGMTAGIWIDPFTINLNTPFAVAHSEWLLKAGGLGASMLGENERLLDVTIPEAYQYVKGLFAKISNDWGFDGLVEADFVYRLLFAEGYRQQDMSHVDVFRLGMTAIRDGFGPDKLIVSMPPMPVNFAYTDVLRIGEDCAPIWRKSPEHWPWGCVDTLSNAAHRYYFVPHLWIPDSDCAYFGLPATRKRWDVEQAPELTKSESLAWLTGAVLSGGALKIGDYFPDLTPEQTAILRRLLPTPSWPARPVDLFERQDPCIWSMPVRSKIGEWQVVAVFNWDEKQSVKIPVSLERLGLQSGQPYAVYDFWLDQFYGVARDRLDVDVAPGSVHLLCFRRYEEHPMFLSTDRHFSMGATDFTALKWDAASRKLAASFDGVEDTDYNLRVLVPETYVPQNVACSTGEVTWIQEGRMLKIAFHCARNESVDWAVQF